MAARLKDVLTILGEIQNVFKDDRVIHRAALEVSAIRQDLLIDFGQEDLEATPPPLAGLLAIEKETCGHQGLRVRPQMIAEQMRFEPLAGAIAPAWPGCRELCSRIS